MIRKLEELSMNACPSLQTKLYDGWVLRFADGYTSFRGNGYGKDIINAIHGTALQMKVTTAYLQVTVGNTPAEKLYDEIGFKEVYKYWYRILQK